MVLLLSIGALHTLEKVEFSRAEGSNHMSDTSSSTQISEHKLKDRLPDRCDVLIVGGGPVGAALANTIALNGCRDIVIVEKASTLGSEGRACNLWARTQEVLHAIGVLEEVRSEALETKKCAIIAFGENLGTANFSDIPSPFQCVLSCPQSVTHHALARKAQQRGVPILMNHEFVSMVQKDTEATVTIRTPDGIKTITASWVVAADGGRSRVREAAGIELEEIPISEAIIAQIDARVKWGAPVDTDTWRMYLLPDGQAGVMPMPNGMARLFSTRNWNSDHGIPERLPTLLEMQSQMRKITGDYTMELSDPGWTGWGRLSLGIAREYRKGRVILIGDAGHKAIPVGGQGMNSGLQDAMALGWRLAAVANKRAADSLIDSYAKERHSTRDKLAREQKKQFARICGPNGKVSQQIIKFLVKKQVKLDQLSDLPGRDINMLDIAYLDSDLSVDIHSGSKDAISGIRMPSIRLGENAPAKPSVETNTHDHIRPDTWTIFVLDGGSASAAKVYTELKASLPEFVKLVPIAAAQTGYNELEAAVFQAGKTLLTDFDKRVEKALGLSSAILAVRPDGHIGLVANLMDVKETLDYLTTWAGFDEFSPSVMQAAE